MGLFFYLYLLYLLYFFIYIYLYLLIYFFHINERIFIFLNVISIFHTLLNLNFVKKYKKRTQIRY